MAGKVDVIGTRIENEISRQAGREFKLVSVLWYSSDKPDNTSHRRLVFRLELFVMAQACSP